MKQILKNLIGKRTNRKLIAFYVDDWGSVRTKDTKSLDFLRRKGVSVENNRFTLNDTLASEDDLSILYQTLHSVNDKNGNSACFTAVMNPCNPNFEAIRANGFTEFVSEPFTETLKKYGTGYDRSFELWQEGMNGKVFYPMFHGTEHVSRSQFMKALQNSGEVDQWAFECESVGVPGGTKAMMQPYYIEEKADNLALELNIKDGLTAFERIFGFRSKQFKAGGDVISPDLYSTLRDNGIEYLDETLVAHRHLGDGKYKKEFNYIGKINRYGQKLLVRNCVFEPSNAPHCDSVGLCMRQIDAAFKCNKPALVSSHRVNFVGGLSEANRKTGIDKLGDLLQHIERKYPDVEFVNADQVGDIIFKK